MIRVEAWLLGRAFRVRLTLGGGDDDNGSDPGDITTTPVPVGFTGWPGWEPAPAPGQQ